MTCAALRDFCIQLIAFFTLISAYLMKDGVWYHLRLLEPTNQSRVDAEDLFTQAFQAGMCLCCTLLCAESAYVTWCVTVDPTPQKKIQKVCRSKQHTVH